jgi:hypothetical protein
VVFLEQVPIHRGERDQKKGRRGDLDLSNQIEQRQRLPVKQPEGERGHNQIGD